MPPTAGSNVWWPTGGARVPHVIQVYGEAERARSADGNLRIVVDAMAWLRSLGNAPAVIVGDLS
eukprot:5816768-Lingulodinium_polyedra.AAC.1